MRQRDTIRDRLSEPVRAVVRPPLRNLARSEQRPASTRRRLPASAIVVLLAVAATVIIQGFRLSAAPDVFGDEGAYLEVARHIARGAGLTDSRGPYFWHPPLFMVLEAAFIKIRGLGSMHPLPELFDVRWVNVGLSALTAGLLAMLGLRLRGLRLAVLLSLLFVLDPYVERISRRNMLETATIFFVVLAIYLFAAGERHRSPWRWLGTGLALGLAVLTKEPAALFLLVPIGYGMFADRSRLGDGLRSVATAVVVYLTYVVGITLGGQGSQYLAFKWFELQRISHGLLGTRLGAPPGGGALQTGRKLYTSFNLLYLVRQYASSYLLIGLALCGVVILLVRFADDKRARLLAVWMAVSAAAGAALVPVSDQYSYYLVVPAIVVAGYLLDYAIGRYGRSPRTTIVAVVSVAVVLCCTTFGSYRWFTNYAAGSDNCYSRVAAYIQAHVRPGSTIESSNEVSNYFLTYRYHIRMDRSSSVVIARRARLFILSSKDAWAGNQGTTSAYYGWVKRHSREVFACRDATFWKLGVYYRWRNTP